MLRCRRRMRILLLRPRPGNERFGLGPFFRIEPLGMAYVAAALEARGYDVVAADLRFSSTAEHLIARHRPALFGIACMHALETDDALALAARVKRASPDAAVVIGGHSAAAYPRALVSPAVDAIVVGDGEQVMPDVADALAHGRPLSKVRGLVVRTTGGELARSSQPESVFELDEVPVPARHHFASCRRQYACLAHRPAWLVETARGCPFRCSFCSVWQLHERRVRERGIGHVVTDFARVGDHVFVADDLFWHHPARSRDLASALRSRRLRKQWLLVQSRVDTVARHPELLAAWRPLAREFDVFFGFEAPTDAGLRDLTKDTTVALMREGIGAAREHGYGVTGNFVIDPAWREADFERLWAFVEEQRLWQAGFTILTPLPGTAYYEAMRPRLRATDWAQFDMHHLLWEPALGAERFFELYCETWRRSVLNVAGQKRWWHWARDVELRNAWFLLRALRRSQRMMSPRQYLAEHRLGSTAWEGFSNAGYGMPDAG
jgi:radical SAM superfamily enzyme YgiQ (UPF0313 family)